MDKTLNTEWITFKWDDLALFTFTLLFDIFVFGISNTVFAFVFDNHVQMGQSGNIHFHIGAN